MSTWPQALEWLSNNRINLSWAWSQECWPRTMLYTVHVTKTAGVWSRVHCALTIPSSLAHSTVSPSPTQRITERRKKGCMQGRQEERKAGRKERKKKWKNDRERVERKERWRKEKKEERKVKAERTQKRKRESKRRKKKPILHRQTYTNSNYDNLKTQHSMMLPHVSPVCLTSFS